MQGAREEEEEMKKLPNIQIDGLIDLAVSLKDGEVFRQRNIPIPVLVNLKAIFLNFPEKFLNFSHQRITCFMCAAKLMKYLQ